MNDKIAHIAAALTVGAPRIVIDGVLIIAIISGIFWCGSISERLAENHAVLAELPERQREMEETRATVSAIEARQMLVLDRLSKIDQRLQDDERRK